MTEDIDVPENETGVVRLFAIDLPEAEVARFARLNDGAEGGRPAWPLREALGAVHLDHERIEIFPASDVPEAGVADYLTQGLGLSESLAAVERARLGGLRGHVVVVSSDALGGVGQRLVPRPPLRYIGTYREAPLEAPPLPRRIDAPEAATEPGTPDPETSEADVPGADVPETGEKHRRRRGKLAKRAKPVKHVTGGLFKALVVVTVAILVGTAVAVGLALSMG